MKSLPIVALMVATLACTPRLAPTAASPILPSAKVAPAANIAPAPRALPPSFPWVPDLGDGSYRNPIIHADYSDPDVIRVGDEYFLTASSFTSTPGLPILRSRDLVNWTIVGYALQNLPSPRYDVFQKGAGVWAPAIREHAGTFYIFVPFPDEGIFVVEARHPSGPWTPPRLLIAGRGLIDPCPFWDDDGRAYLVHAYAGSRAGIKDRLRVRPMAPDTSSVLGDGEIVFHQPDRHPTLEGPKLYKRNGWYYILAPAGGVPRGWQVALRSRGIFGPYEDKIVLQQGRTPINGPHQGALVDTPAGDWWFVHFQDAGLYGRIVHLNPVVWKDDWPLMGIEAPGTEVSGATIREPVLSHRKPSLPTQAVDVPQTSDEFTGGVLGLQWQWLANHQDDWATMIARPGFLRLKARATPPEGLGTAPHLLLQKLPAPTFALETSIDVSGIAASGIAGAKVRGGLVVTGAATAALLVGRGDSPDSARIELRVDDKVVAEISVKQLKLGLGMSMDRGGLCRFWYRSLARAGDAKAGAVIPLGPSFQSRAGRWVGAKVGLVAVLAANSAEAAPASAPVAAAAPSFVDFDFFRFAPRESVAW